MTTKLILELRLENDQVDNTWFSTGSHDDVSDVHVHMSREMYHALGSPQNIMVGIMGIKKCN